MLWRTKEPTSRHGRWELSVDRIVRAAIEIAARPEDVPGGWRARLARVLDGIGVVVEQRSSPARPC
jgi:hypothetical protein